MSDDTKKKFLPIRLLPEEYERLETRALKNKKSPSGFATEAVLQALGLTRQVKASPSSLRNLQYRRKMRKEMVDDIDL